MGDKYCKFCGKELVNNVCPNDCEKKIEKEIDEYKPFNMTKVIIYQKTLYCTKCGTKLTQHKYCPACDNGEHKEYLHLWNWLYSEIESEREYLQDIERRMISFGPQLASDKELAKTVYERAMDRRIEHMGFEHQKQFVIDMIAEYYWGNSNDK